MPRKRKAADRRTFFGPANPAKSNEELARHALSRSLKQLGFHSDKAYFESDLFDRVRLAAFENYPFCLRCAPEDACHVHLMRYDVQTLTGKALKYVVPLCWDCFDHVTYNEDGSLRTLAESNKIIGFENIKELTPRTTTTGT